MTSTGVEAIESSVHESVQMALFDAAYESANKAWTGRAGIASPDVTAQDGAVQCAGKNAGHFFLDGLIDRSGTFDEEARYGDNLKALGVLARLGGSTTLTSSPAFRPERMSIDRLLPRFNLDGPAFQSRVILNICDSGPQGADKLRCEFRAALAADISLQIAR